MKSHVLLSLWAKHLFIIDGFLISWMQYLCLLFKYAEDND